jgi:hypothetical protein
MVESTTKKPEDIPEASDPTEEESKNEPVQLSAAQKKRLRQKKKKEEERLAAEALKAQQIADGTYTEE